MKAAIYIRVSTEEQAKEGYSVKAQLEKLKAFCFSQNWEIANTYLEEGKSAKDLERPQLQKMLSELNVFDVVVVYKLDRLSRSVSDINHLLNTFEKNDVSFRSSTEPYDTTSSQGKLLINIFASLAQFEREQLAERVHFGMKQMTLEGKRAGGKAPFGYVYENGKLVISPVESKWVKFIFDNYKSKGQKAIAAELNNMGIKSSLGNYWRSPVVYSIATNPIYSGYIRWNYRKTGGKKTGEEIIVKGEHDPIVSKEQFDEVQEVITQRAGKGFKGHVHYPFTGLLKCARCESPMVGARKKKKHGYHRFYRCTGRFHSGICDMPVIAEPIIEEEFLKRLELPAYNEQKIEKEADNTEEIQRQLAKIKKKMALIKELYTDGDYTKQEYREKLERERKKEEALTRQLRTSSSDIDYKLVNEIIHNMKAHWQHFTYEGRKEMLHTIVESLTIEVKEAHTGGPGKKTKIEITDHQMK